MTVSQSTKDLEAARATATFSPDKLGDLLDPHRARKLDIKRIIASDPTFKKGHKPYLSRGGRIETGLKVANRLLELQHQHKWTPEQYQIAMVAVDDWLGLNLHETAFQPVINSQGSDEQKKIWMPLAMSHRILGCYLQTELSHGSNVQKLETTATYFPDSEEFEIHSPTVGSTKWWIGSLGVSATHGAVQARLIINGKDYGPHLFLCQLRSLDDHSLMPGIEIGEIGPKALGGMSAVDNGWARFNHVRIPANQMLNRFANVAKDGTYTQPPHAKLSYGGMLYIRAQMIETLGWQLAKGATIATRYLHIRRQFLPQGSSNLERQVFTYPSVYMRLLPQIARSYAFIVAGKDMAQIYNSMASKLASGDTTLLAETHAISSGLKVYVSTQAVDGLEVCRRACGGHGYMESAGIGRLYASVLPSTTYEGDNYILNLQVARAALKSLQAVATNPSHAIGPSSAYLSTLATSLPVAVPSDGSGWRSRSLQVQLTSLRAAMLVKRLGMILQSGRPFEDLSWECVAVSKAVTEAYLVRRTLEALDNGVLSKAGPKEKAVLDRLFHFYALEILVSAVPDLLELGVIAAPGIEGDSPVEILRQELDAVAKELLPEAVTLVDSFAYSDFDLDTTIGRYDGRAYESLLEKAKEDLDLNVGDAATRQRIYDEAIRPVLLRGKAALEKSKL